MGRIILLIAMLFCVNSYAANYSQNTCYSEKDKSTNVIILDGQNITFRGVQYTIQNVQKFTNGGVLYIFMDNTKTNLLGINPKPDNSSDYAIIDKHGNNVDSGYCLK